MISETSSGFYVSDSPGICKAGQNSTVKATDGSGVLTLNRTRNKEFSPVITFKSLIDDIAARLNILVPVNC